MKAIFLLLGNLSLENMIKTVIIDKHCNFEVYTMGKKKYEARGFADEWKVRREKKLAKEERAKAARKAAKAADKAAA